MCHLTWVAELLAVTRVQNISPPLSVKDRGVSPARAVLPLPLRGRGHLSEQRDLARARAAQRRGIPLFPLPSSSLSAPPRRQDLEAQRDLSEQRLRDSRRRDRVPLVYVNAERIARALILLNGQPFPEEPLKQLAQEVQIPPNQLVELLRHLEAVVNSSIAEHGIPLPSLLSTSLTNLAFAAAGGDLRAAFLYSNLDAAINRLRRVEYPKILNLLRQQIRQIGGYIAADAVVDQGSGQTLIQQRIPARSFGVDDVVIPGDPTRQQQYRGLLDHFYQRSNDNNPITTFGENSTMRSLRSPARSGSGLPQMQIPAFPCTCGRGRCTWVPRSSTPCFTTHCPLHCSYALMQAMDKYLEAYGQNSFVSRSTDIYLCRFLLFAAAGVVLFALNGQTETNTFEGAERAIQQRVPAQGTSLPEGSPTLLRLGMAAISAVMGFFVRGKLTRRDVVFPASFNYPFPPRPGC